MHISWRNLAPRDPPPPMCFTITELLKHRFCRCRRYSPRRVSFYGRIGHYIRAQKQCFPRRKRWVLVLLSLSIRRLHHLICHSLLFCLWMARWPKLYNIFISISCEMLQGKKCTSLVRCFPNNSNIIKTTKLPPFPNVFS